jgi:hypothetical protein
MKKEFRWLTALALCAVSMAGHAGIITITQDRADIRANINYRGSLMDPCGRDPLGASASYSGPLFGGRRSVTASLPANCGSVSPFAELTATGLVARADAFRTGQIGPTSAFSSVTVEFFFTVSGSDILASVSMPSVSTTGGLFDASGRLILGPVISGASQGPLALADGAAYRFFMTVDPTQPFLSTDASLTFANVTAMARVPEPAALSLLTLGLLGAARVRRRQSTAQKQ